jgi:phosphoenolpyruvate-protein phosphotransferase/dihydroxyacetone kinase phosphotransfer subunit
MIGFVIVSHSARLAEGVIELAEQVAQGQVRLVAAGGTGDPDNPIGTNAFRVLAAIESVYSADGVLVFTDLGSAVLSAETALDMLDPAKRAKVKLCDAPLVEGTVAAASLAGAGAGFDEIARGEDTAAGVAAGPREEVLITLVNRLGLHARPGAQIVRLARRYQARVAIENRTAGTGPAAATSINAILGLGARQGHQLRIQAQGPDVRQALAELAAFIESGCGDREGAGPPAGAAGKAAQGQLAGVPASAGVAVGPLLKLRPAIVDGIAQRADDPEAERQRFLAAIHAAQEETRSSYEWAKAHIGENEAGIFDAQLLLLEDPDLVNGVSRMILGERASAEAAWQAVMGKISGQVGRLDAGDVAARVLRRLAGIAPGSLAPDRPAILSAHNLMPSEVKDLDPAFVLGLCLETGSASAHSVILARALGIPVVAGLGPAISALADGTTIALDGERGSVWVSPDPEQMRDLTERQQLWRSGRAAAQAGRHKSAATRDGRRIRVYANISSVAEAREAVTLGAEGIGVLRTEFLFLGRKSAPTEEEQFAAYRAIAEALDGRPLTIRTLDAGGDKPLPYIETSYESNPFLGWRGIRVTLARRNLLRTQLEAILRTGSGHEVEILLPMVSSVAELRQAKAVLREVETNVHGTSHARLGVMIEVPAAVAIADQLAGEASFFSIGTNDLIQYVMAADRTNARVAPLADPFQPAVLRVIHQAVEAGRRAGIPVALCGEMAADPLATPLLLGLGLEEFSVSAPLIPELKQAIGRWSSEEAGSIARQALALDSAESVRELLTTIR